MRFSTAEDCHRCGAENTLWFAPSPLWNLVMRGNDILGDVLYDDMVCLPCFIHLAAEAGVSGVWRLSVDPEPPGLIKTTPSGRIWDETANLWRDPAWNGPALPPERLAGEVVLKGCGWCGHSAGHTTDEHVERWGLPGDAS